MFEPVLVVDDDTMQQDMLAILLEKKAGMKACMASNGREALDMLEQDKSRKIKMVMMDLNMPVMGGLEALEIITQRYPGLPVIMATGSRDVDDAIEAMRLGAVDFINKPYKPDRIVVTVRNAMKLSALSKEVRRLTKEKGGTFLFDNLIGFDGGLYDVVGVARKASASDIPVLVTGETGVGKEVFAKAIHGESHRAGKPFIAVNCGAIPEQLVESTLFGHEKGAFTGATDRATGKFREADGGTIFLDEVGELPLDSQVKLLRVLQQKEVEPVGGSRPIAVNVRIVSATNRNLEEEVKAGRFREDLYFRLNVLQLEIPPLRKRKQDIEALANHFIERFCAQEGRPLCHLTEQGVRDLVNHDWPGNVRELENTMNRAMVLNDGVELEIGPFDGRLVSESETVVPFSTTPSRSFEYSLFDAQGRLKTIETIEREAMAFALKHNEGNISQAAKDLGMAKSTFYRKLDEYDLKR